jgi:hypothetical protein
MCDTASPVSSMDERELVRMISAQKRVKPASPGWRCPSAEQVAAYLEQRLAGDDKARFEAHLAHCDFCIGLLSFLVRQQEAEEHVEVPALLVRQAVDAVPEEASASRSWRWVLAPALAAIVVASTVLLKSPQPAQFTPPDVPAPPVATTTPPMSVPKSQSRPVRTPEIRSLTTPTTGLQLLEPLPGSIVRGEELHFRWKAVVNAAYYEIRVVNSEGDPVWRAESTGPTAQVPASLSLRPGKYFVWVRAHLSDGRTLKSETIAFRIGSSS